MPPAGDDRFVGLQIAGIDAHEVEDALEVVVAVVFEFDASLLGGVVDDSVGGEAVADLTGQLADEGFRFPVELVAARGHLAVWCFLVLVVMDEFFGGARLAVALRWKRSLRWNHKRHDLLSRGS